MSLHLFQLLTRAHKTAFVCGGRSRSMQLMRVRLCHTMALMPHKAVPSANRAGSRRKSWPYIAHLPQDTKPNFGDTSSSQSANPKIDRAHRHSNAQEDVIDGSRFVGLGFSSYRADHLSPLCICICSHLICSACYGATMRSSISS